MGKRKERATERLNLALSRISATATVLEDTIADINGVGDRKSLKNLRQQIDDAIDEAHAALADIRDLAATL